MLIQGFTLKEIEYRVGNLAYHVVHGEVATAHAKTIVETLGSVGFTHLEINPIDADEAQVIAIAVRFAEVGDGR